MSATHRKYKLSDVAEVLRGISFGSSEGQDRPLENHLPVLRAGNIQDRLLVETDLVWVPKSRVNPNQLIKQHDIIMCTSSGSASLVGKCARAESDWQGSFGAFCAGIRPKKDKCDPSYLHHFLRSSAFTNWSTISSGANIKNIRKSELEEFEIPLPPLDEQRRIAAILDKADAIRRKRQESIRLTEEFLRSTFLEMFGDPVTNPKGWEVVGFGDYCEELRYGTSVMCKSEPQAGNLPVLRIPNVIGARILWEDLKYASLPETEIKRLRLVQGDILFVRTNGNPDYIGRCAVFEGNKEAIYASYLIRGRMKAATKLLPHFAQFCFSLPTYRSRIVAEAKTTAGNYNINTEGLRSLKLPLPPLNKQQDFVELRRKVLASTSTLIIGENASIELFNSLTRRAFRGEL